MEKTIKHRLYTWFETVPDANDPSGETNVRQERIAHLGQTIDITDEVSLRRGEELGAFFSDEEAAAIANGTYQGSVADAVYRARSGVRAAQVGEQEQLPAGEGIDVHEASSEELGDYIKENRLNVQATKDLIPDNADVDLLEKFYDAEGLATDNEPRKGVSDYIDARLAAASQS